MANMISPSATWRCALFCECGRRVSVWAAPDEQRVARWPDVTSSHDEVTTADRAILWDGGDNMVVVQLDAPVPLPPDVRTTVGLTLGSYPELEGQTA